MINTPQHQSTRTTHRGIPTIAPSVNAIPSSASGQGATISLKGRNNEVLPDNTGTGSGSGNRGF